MTRDKLFVFLAKATGMVVLAAIFDMAFQYFTKPEINFYRTAIFALVFGLGNFIIGRRKNNKL